MVQSRLSPEPDKEVERVTGEFVVFKMAFKNTPLQIPWIYNFHKKCKRGRQNQFRIAVLQSIGSFPFHEGSQL